MNLREEFEKEKGYDCYAYSQDYAGAEQYKDGFNDEYVEWLESKVNNVALYDVSVCNMQDFMEHYHNSKHIFNDKVIDVLKTYKR
jgi:hypothetical protein